MLASEMLHALTENACNIYEEQPTMPTIGCFSGLLALSLSLSLSLCPPPPLSLSLSLSLSYFTICTHRCLLVLIHFMSFMCNRAEW